jgi:hypothetical protein
MDHKGRLILLAYPGGNQIWGGGGQVKRGLVELG